MSGAISGLDVEAVQRLASELDSSAERLQWIELKMRGHIYQISWLGQDFTAFAQRWDSQLGPIVRRATDGMRHAAFIARANADEQIAASAPVSSGRGLLGWLTRRGEDLHDAGSSVAGWVGDRAVDAWNLGNDAAGWASDRAEEAFEWVCDRADAIADDWGNVADHGGNFWNATGGAVLNGQMPRATAVVGSALGLGGAYAGALITTATGGMYEANLFDDGIAYVGEAREIARSTAPVGLGDYTAGVTEGYGRSGTIRITQVGAAPSYVVELPGTENWSPRAGGNPMDLTGNIVTAGGNMSTMSRAVEMAIQQNIPAGSNVMLVGHSQGGMTAADIAADPSLRSDYNITHLVTYGAPVENTAVPLGTSVLNMQHAGDIVPKLDLNGMRIDGVQAPTNTANVTTVTFDNPSTGTNGGVPSSLADQVIDNHSHQNYTESINRSSDPALQGYLSDPSIQQYFVRGDAPWRTIEVGVGRRDR